MTRKEWSPLDWFQHKLFHWLSEVLIHLHDNLIEYACARNLWRTPEERAAEQPPQDQE
jgi:hypothetical protein